MPMANRERQLRKALDATAADYDVILIDCPPSLGLLTVNALTAVDAVISPSNPMRVSRVGGPWELITTIDLVKRQLNPKLDVLGVLMTMYDARTRSAHVVEEVRSIFRNRFLKRWCRDRSALRRRQATDNRSPNMTANLEARRHTETWPTS